MQGQSNVEVQGMLENEFSKVSNQGLGFERDYVYLGHYV